MSKYAKLHRRKVARRQHLDRKAIQYLWNQALAKPTKPRTMYFNGDAKAEIGPQTNRG